MIMFASDLDRTLIYSRKSFGFNSAEIRTAVRLIESKEEQEISFMTEKAVVQLTELAGQLQFVPVTTRTIEQYQRIALFQEEIKPSYAITSNGGHVLVDGSVDQEWQLIMKHRVQDGCLPMENIIDRFEKDLMHPEWVFSSRSADGFFYYCIIDRECAPASELHGFHQWLDEGGWMLYIQGRKLYLIPKGVNKRDAVEFVKNRTGSQAVAAAGDSLLDVSMLSYADVGISPVHGEIYGQRLEAAESSSIKFTIQPGIRAAEEILRCVSEFAEQAKKQATL